MKTSIRILKQCKYFLSMGVLFEAGLLWGLRLAHSEHTYNDLFQPFILVGLLNPEMPYAYSTLKRENGSLKPTDLLELSLSEVHVGCIVVGQAIWRVCFHCCLIVPDGVHKVTHELKRNKNKISKSTYYLVYTFSMNVHFTLWSTDTKVKHKPSNTLRMRRFGNVGRGVLGNAGASRVLQHRAHHLTQASAIQANQSTAKKDCFGEKSVRKAIVAPATRD